jgi:hypothetical protein
MSNHPNLISRVTSIPCKNVWSWLTTITGAIKPGQCPSDLETRRLSREGMNHWRFPSTYLNPGLMKRCREDPRPAGTGLLPDVLVSAVR